MTNNATVLDALVRLREAQMRRDAEDLKSVIETLDARHDQLRREMESEQGVRVRAALTPGQRTTLKMLLDRAGRAWSDMARLYNAGRIAEAVPFSQEYRELFSDAIKMVNAVSAHLHAGEPTHHVYEFYCPPGCSQKVVERDSQGRILRITETRREEE